MVGKYIKIANFLCHIQSYTFRKHHPDYRPGSLITLPITSRDCKSLFFCGYIRVLKISLLPEPFTSMHYFEKMFGICSGYVRDFILNTKNYLPNPSRAVHWGLVIKSPGEFIHSNKLSKVTLKR